MKIHLKFKAISTLALLFIVLLSCKKTKEFLSLPEMLSVIPEGLFDDSTKDYDGYLGVVSTHFGYDSTKPNSIVAAAQFFEQNHYEDVGSVSIGDFTVPKIDSNIYFLDFNAANLINQGNAMFGNRAEFNFDGNLVFPTPQPKSIYIPKKIFIHYYQNYIRKDSNLTIMWGPDYDNPFDKIILNIYYLHAYSEMNGVPRQGTIEDINVITSDNGSATVNSSLLQRFPTNGYVAIRLIRAYKEDLLLTRADNSTRSIYYFAVTQSKTGALKIKTSP